MYRIRTKVRKLNKNVNFLGNVVLFSYQYFQLKKLFCKFEHEFILIMYMYIFYVSNAKISIKTSEIFYLFIFGTPALICEKKRHQSHFFSIFKIHP